jgi:signal transduction histidine kinase
MVENANVNFECQLPENIPNVFFGWKRNRNTYLLIKEAVNNALKHAEAKTITLDFLITDNLIISIKDDGKGFDTTQNFTGNGLNNYKKRIADLNATYILQSEIGIGTNVEFHIPFTI